MPQNRSIHGLRGLAILLVFVLHAHLAMVTGAFPSAPAEGSLAAMVLGYGHRGVELFFMISGYLIVASLVRHNRISRFVTQRAIRIYPAFLGPHLLVFLAGPWVGYARMSDLDAPQWTIHFVSNLLMLPGLFDLFIANPVAWTLSLEMAFYLLAAWAYAIVVCRNRAAKMAMGLAWMAAAGTVLAWHPRAWFFAAGAGLVPPTMAGTITAFCPFAPLDRRFGPGAPAAYSSTPTLPSPWPADWWDLRASCPSATYSAACSIRAPCSTWEKSATASISGT